MENHTPLSDNKQLSYNPDPHTPIQLVGIVTKDTGKAWAIHTHADGITRYIAKSQIIATPFEPQVGCEFIGLVPLWLLKRRDGTYPAWTGVRHGTGVEVIY